MQVESHHSSSSVQTEQRIEGEKQRHTTRPSAADSNKQHYIPSSPRRSYSKPNPAQPSPSLIFAAPCSLSRTTSNPKSQPVPVLIGRPSSMAILGSRSLRATPYLTAADGVNVSWARFQIHVPSCHGTGWLRDIAQLVSDSVAVDWPPGQQPHVISQLSAKRRGARAWPGVGCSHQSEMRLALLGMRSPKGLQSAIPCQASIMNRFSWVRLARSQGRYCKLAQ